MEFLRKNKYLIFLILWSFFFLSIGLKWGLPSGKINSLYFYKKENLDKTVHKIKEYKEEVWKGYGYYFTLHPEEEEKKLPRNFYNPIRSYHPDEYFILKVLSSMDPSKFNFNPHQSTVGGAYIYLVGVFIFLLSKIKIIKLTKDLSFYFYNPDEFAKLYIAGRLITVFFGIGIIVLSYLISSKIYKKKEDAFLMSLLLTFTPLIILNSLYMYVDIPGLFWITGCLYYSLKTIEKLNFKHSLLSGIFSGLAAGTKINLFTSLFLPFFSSILNFKNIKTFIISLIYTIGGFILSFGITNPYFFITYPLPIIELKQHAPINFNGKFYFSALGYGIGWPFFALFLIGIILNNKNFLEKEKSLILFWILFYFTFISFFSKTYARYILPIVPSIIILGYNFYCEGRKIKTIKSVLLYFSLAYTVIYGLSFKSLFLKDNVRTKAGMWIKENIEKGKSIGVCEVPWQFQLPPFDYFEYKVIVVNYNYEKLKIELPDYFIISSFQGKIPPYPHNLQRERIEFWQKFINSNLYKPIKIFEKPLSFSYIKFRFKILPEDLIYINPTIIIFMKNV